MRAWVFQVMQDKPLWCRLTDGAATTCFRNQLRSQPMLPLSSRKVWTWICSPLPVAMGNAFDLRQRPTVAGTGTELLASRRGSGERCAATLASHGDLPYAIRLRCLKQLMTALRATCRLLIRRPSMEGHAADLTEHSNLPAIPSVIVRASEDGPHARPRAILSVAILSPILCLTSLAYLLHMPSIPYFAYHRDLTQDTVMSLAIGAAGLSHISQGIYL